MTKRNIVHIEIPTKQLKGLGRFLSETLRMAYRAR